MLFGDKTKDSVQQLISEVKVYLELQKEYVRLELVEKLTILLSTLILVLILIVLSMVALFYFSFTMAYMLAPVLGGLKMSFGLITVCLTGLIILIYYQRKRLIILPMVKFLASVFLEKPKDSDIYTHTSSNESTES